MVHRQKSDVFSGQRGGGVDNAVRGGRTRVSTEVIPIGKGFGVGVGVGLGVGGVGGQTKPEPEPTPTPDTFLAAPGTHTTPTATPDTQDAPRPATAAEARGRGRAIGKTHPGGCQAADAAATAAECRREDPWRAWLRAYDRAVTQAPANPAPVAPPPILPGTTGPVSRAQAAAASGDQLCEHGHQVWQCRTCQLATAAALAQMRLALQSGQPFRAEQQGVSP